MLTLIRGVPGSGKTTLAQQMLKEGRVQKHFEADMFFTDSQGVYKYDPAKIKEAHAWCQRQTKKALQEGFSVVVSNTFVKLWEMHWYKDLAKELGVPIRVYECTGVFANVHGVPSSVIASMRFRWENDTESIPVNTSRKLELNPANCTDKR